jgi:pyruvate dehydrogenase E1 component alpha subunit
MSSVLPAEGDLRRVIGDGAAIPDGEVDGLSHDDLLALYRNLVLLRTYDERSVIYHRQGRIGTYAIFWNHEAMQARSVFALEDRDWIFPSYRESAIGLLRGIPASTILSWWRGHPTGWWNPEEHNVASICVPIGTHVPHAVGYAWGARLKGEDRVAIAYFGDGATSEGAVHEGATFAGVMRAPAILFCNNNQWAISTPLSEQTAAPTLADKAIGYGMPGVRVDGGDVLAVYEATRDAVARARPATARPSEAVSYRRHRMRPRTIRRSTSTPTASRRRDRTSASGASSATPTGRSPSEEGADAVRTEALELMRAGIATAEAEPAADPALVFEHAYADPPASQAHDLAELRRLLGG